MRGILIDRGWIHAIHVAVGAGATRAPVLNTAVYSVRRAGGRVDARRRAQLSRELYGV